ncbi:MAG TPA: fructose-6-phosphate aldolase [Deltaproteobacteria bacterium]|nr:fructose-6-phosphate aldolase [Deltaproteobacteria bacterium]
MEFFLDTASIEEISRYKELGLVDGVTTNPQLLSKEGKDPLEQVKEIASIVSGPISVEVTNTEPQRMVEQARGLASIAENIVIKVPASVQGISVAGRLKAEGIKTNITLVFHPSQAAPFIKMGVEFISLFVGRVEDFGLDNTGHIRKIRSMIDEMKSPTRLLAASIRNPDYLVASITDGAHAVTVPPACWEKVYNNPMFNQGEREFLESWQKLPPVVREKYESLTVDAHGEVAQNAS